jgi:ribose 5-phosphate isomerase B
MKIFLGTDHAGFELKRHIKRFLLDEGHDVEDLGAKEFNKGDDYPDFIRPAAKKVASNKGSMGIIFGSSGQGEAIAANKIKGARAALYYGHEKEIITLSREHNDANILSLGAKFLTKEQAAKAVRLWLSTEFTNEERHVRRIKKIE